MKDDSVISQVTSIWLVKYWKCSGNGASLVLNLERIFQVASTAAFQWLAFGCETKYQHHLNNHTRLGRFLRSLGEKAAADWWETLDLTRQAGWYGGGPDPADAHKTLSLLEQIRLWATQ